MGGPGEIRVDRPLAKAGSVVPSPWPQENVPGIVGFSEAVKISSQKNMKNMEKLRDKLINEMLKIENTRLNGPKEKRLCNNVNLFFKDVEGETLGGYLDAQGICISTGSACASNTKEKSHVLKAIGLNDKEINECVRISLSKYNMDKEIDEVISAIKKNVEKLRNYK